MWGVPQGDVPAASATGLAPSFEVIRRLGHHHGPRQDQRQQSRCSVAIIGRVMMGAHWA
jgi:hypothetical protein